jgi:hypothetical protein
MDLKTWLKEQAELSGSKLTAAINACEGGLVDSVKDLLQLYEKNDLGLVFPQAMIQSNVKAVLERDKDNIKAQDSTTNEKKSPKVPKVPTVSSSSAIPQAEKQTQPQSSATKNIDQMIALQLPPGKLYHFFASHKVRSVFELCVLFRLYVIILLICYPSRKRTLFTAQFQRLSPEQQRTG